MKTLKLETLGLEKKDVVTAALVTVATVITHYVTVNKIDPTHSMRDRIKKLK